MQLTTKTSRRVARETFAYTLVETLYENRIAPFAGPFCCEYDYRLVAYAICTLLGRYSRDHPTPPSTARIDVRIDALRLPPYYPTKPPSDYLVDQHLIPRFPFGGLSSDPITTRRYRPLLLPTTPGLILQHLRPQEIPELRWNRFGAMRTFNFLLPQTSFSLLQQFPQPPVTRRTANPKLCHMPPNLLQSIIDALIHVTDHALRPGALTDYLRATTEIGLPEKPLKSALIRDLSHFRPISDAQQRSLANLHTTDHSHPYTDAFCWTPTTFDPRWLAPEQIGGTQAVRSMLGSQRPPMFTPVGSDTPIALLPIGAERQRSFFRYHADQWSPKLRQPPPLPGGWFLNFEPRDVPVMLRTHADQDWLGHLPHQPGPNLTHTGVRGHAIVTVPAHHIAGFAKTVVEHDDAEHGYPSRPFRPWPGNHSETQILRHTGMRPEHLFPALRNRLPDIVWENVQDNHPGWSRDQLTQAFPWPKRKNN